MSFKNLTAILLALLSVNCLSQSNSFKLKGTVSTDYDGYIYLSYGENQDSAIVKNKAFVFEGQVDFPIEARLHTKNGHSNGELYLENSSMEVEIIIDGAVTFLNSIKGNKTHQLSKNLRAYFLEVMSEPDFSSKLYHKLDSIFTANPRNQFCGMILADAAPEQFFTYEQVYNLLSKLDQTVQNKEDMGSLKVSLNKLKTIKIGTKLKPFEFPDSNGNRVNISDFKGDFLLVEFWAAWCAPCRERNPKLRKTYDEYNQLGFEIFGVSLDIDKDDWLKAIEKDGLTWVNTIAQEGMNNKVIKSLGIQHIPSNYLIDKSGNILAINIEPVELEQKLDQLLVK